MIIKGNFKNKRREMTLIVVISIVLVLFFTGFSIGKGINNTVVETTAEIAEPILIVENGPSISINGKENQGNYNFKVKNYNDEGKLTQVDLEYTIEIISNTDKSIVFKLFNGEEEIPLTENKTKKIMLSKQGKQEQEYKLVITYDRSQVNSIEEIIEDVQIKVHSEQIKI